MLAPWKKSYDPPRQHIKKQRHYFANKGPSNQGYGFSNSHVWLWELDYKESWVQKNWCFWTVVLKTLESPLDCEEIQPVHPKGNQSWIFIGRTDAKAETPILLSTWCEELTHLKRPCCWERLKTGEGDNGGWDGWMTSPPQWTWVWVNSRNWWWTGKPGMLQSMGLQRVGHDWAAGLILNHYFFKICAELDTTDCLPDSLSILALLVSFCHFGFVSPRLLSFGAPTFGLWPSRRLLLSLLCEELCCGEKRTSPTCD